MKNNNFIEEVEKEFDDAFGIYWGNYKNTLYRVNPNDIVEKPSIIRPIELKQFISQKLQEQREELKKEIVEIVDDFIESNGENVLTAVLRIIKSKISKL